MSDPPLPSFLEDPGQARASQKAIRALRGWPTLTPRRRAGFPRWVGRNRPRSPTPRAGPGRSGRLCCRPPPAHRLQGRGRGSHCPLQKRLQRDQAAGQPGANARFELGEADTPHRTAAPVPVTGPPPCPGCQPRASRCPALLWRPQEPWACTPNFPGSSAPLGVCVSTPPTLGGKPQNPCLYHPGGQH